jgi:hypothetical protein
MRRTMENKRGLSAIVATLIIILLVLVAVGIIWVVVRNLIDTGAEQIEISTKCLAVDLRAVSVVPVTGVPENYTITLRRASGGETIDGVKISVFNETSNSGVDDGFLNMSVLQTKTQVFEAVTNANRMEYTAYFKDDSGNKVPCGRTSSYSF